MQVSGLYWSEHSSVWKIQALDIPKLGIYTVSVLENSSIGYT